MEQGPLKRLIFFKSFRCTKEVLWHSLFDDECYRKWTAAFSPSSHAVSDWKQGSKILFLDGEGRGMVAEIETMVENTQMTFRHRGEVKDGVEIPLEWYNGLESYSIAEGPDGTVELTVELDAPESFVDYFGGVFPKALEDLRIMAEA